jgi:hypothetical protein
MEKKCDLLANCIHCKYTGRLLTRDMPFRRCAGVEGVTMSETYSIKKSVASFSVFVSIFNPKFVILLPVVTFTFKLNECF